MTSHDLDVVVLGGGGHVGLPLSLTLADAGLRVGIYDTNQRDPRPDRARRDAVPRDRRRRAAARRSSPTGRLELGSDGPIVERTNQLIVVVGTPVDEFLGPSMTIFERTVDQIAPHLRDGALVVLRSTVYPGTTAYVRQHLAARGCRVDVAFCPERIAEGHALEELHTLPQIVGADDERAGDRAEALFRTLVSKIVRTTTKEAELAKLFTNTWRYMKFAVANQFFMIADQAGVDYTNVLRAIREDYPRAADLPGPGFAAGPCLFKDAMQLAAFTSDHFPMGQAAMQINEGLPAYIVTALERRYGGLQGKTVGILGMAFKSESDDTRASLSYKLRKLLTWAGARVVCTDPYVRGRPPDDARLRARGERDPGPRCAAQGVPRPAHRRQGRRRRLGRHGRRDQALVRILVTGAAGFINGYLVPELLEAGHDVIGLDDFSKYGRLTKSYDDHPCYRFVEGDAKDVALLTELAADCDQVVAAAAMIGGISYFHEFAYELLAENERILASTFDAAIAARKNGHLERIIVVELLDGLRVGDRLSRRPRVHS